MIFSIIQTTQAVLRGIFAFTVMLIVGAFIGLLAALFFGEIGAAIWALICVLLLFQSFRSADA